MAVRARIQRRWLLAFLFGVALFLVPVFVLNLLIDPLWIISGNRLSDVNFAWNERQSKVNRLNAGKVRTDCVVIGTSRSTLLNEKLLNNGNTFNFAVSAASLVDYIQLARYLRQSGHNPIKIIVEVSRGQFRGDKASSVSLDLSPNSLIPTSLSKGALRFSLLTLMNSPSLPRYYDSSFQCKILPNQPQYNPDKNYSKTVRQPLRNNSMALIRELRQVFPDAVFTAYLPPQCAYAQKRMYLEDPEAYVKMPVQLVEVFDRVVDFSLPSPVTLDADNTYDGSHYYPKVMDLVARELDHARIEKLRAVFVTSESDYVSNVADRMKLVRFAPATKSPS